MRSWCLEIFGALAARVTSLPRRKDMLPNIGSRGLDDDAARPPEAMIRLSSLAERVGGKKAPIRWPSPVARIQFAELEKSRPISPSAHQPISSKGRGRASRVLSVLDPSVAQARAGSAPCVGFSVGGFGGCEKFAGRSGGALGRVGQRARRPKMGNVAGLRDPILGFLQRSRASSGVSAVGR